MICPSPVCFLCFLPLPESAPARPGHDITRLTGKIPLFARPIPSMWHSTTAHQPICQHNQKVHRQTEEEEGITYPIRAREEGPSQDVSHYHFPDTNGRNDGLERVTKEIAGRMSCLVFDYILRLPVVITAIDTSRTVTAESMIRLDQP
ncbi:hypothetical protein NEUTE1DRAFT_105296 [Neurospora tetrasperma FGSC 2508]|uniref:Uncharacterized protein n=1 Tax=Neurospora tetrasperma (strain FGSC 2508 / ATCC MYA-4615 / P0657) TaxID=510951 RepID=F8N1H4_NEUT8|nr:uncharacterized protein NEUTE1DRAFT_105296 [Neurospora tetrasperma FGSC 2508]EGO52305.1 hypothetical protein NEUTE1DRAFT_105296 [Neurospora tetrasperma FGSC 2508]